MLSAASLTITTCDSSKAVAEGALWFYLDHRVRARVARHTYGTNCGVSYNASNISHLNRKHLAYIALDGALYLPSSFAVLTQKVGCEYYVFTWHVCSGAVYGEFRCPSASTHRELPSRKQQNLSTHLNGTRKISTTTRPSTPTSLHTEARSRPRVGWMKSRVRGPECLLIRRTDQSPTVSQICTPHCVPSGVLQRPARGRQLSARRGSIVGRVSESFCS